jgi:hypothetical protein
VPGVLKIGTGLIHPVAATFHRAVRLRSQSGRHRRALFTDVGDESPDPVPVGRRAEAVPDGGGGRGVLRGRRARATPSKALFSLGPAPDRRPGFVGPADGT